VYGLRGFEQFSYDMEKDPPTGIETVLLHDRSRKMANLVVYNREMEDRLSAWFEDILGVQLRFELLRNQKIALETKKKETTSFVNEGLGLHQLLFILIPIALAQPFETICIDDPGAHLHPKAQSDLISLLLHIYKKEHKQYIIATHSEHILFAFLAAVAKKEIKKEEIALYYFENKDGTAEVQKVKIDEYGRISGELPGFFEHNVEKMLDYLNSLE
jgi:predicted ATPase